MPAPTYNVNQNYPLSAVSIAAGKNAAALVDLSTVIQGEVWCQMLSGATPPTAGTTFSLRRVIGAKATGNALLSGTNSSGQTTVNVQTAIPSNLTKGHLIALISASTGVGEVCTVTNITSLALTVSAVLENSYANNDLLFLIEQTASGGSVTPGSSWSANSSYDTTLYPPIGIFILHALNTDGSVAVTVSSVVDTVPSIQ